MINQIVVPETLRAGFTLIELLVVVLIIGILAAVALPQYEVAVEKSRASGAMTAARAIKDAQEVFYMANGFYTPNLDDLDLQVPSPKGFRLMLTVDVDKKVQFERALPDAAYHILYSFDNRTSNAGVHYCAAPVSSVKANRICKGYGVMFAGDSSYNRYRLN